MNTDTAAFSLALLLAGSMLVSECEPAPPANLRPVWSNPCHHHQIEITKTPPPSRHLTMRTMRTLRTQMANAKSHYHKELSKIKTIYEGVAKQMKLSNYDYTWLAQKQLQWYKEKLQCLKLGDKIPPLLTVLHTSLQNFSVTFEAMRLYGKSHVAPEGTMEMRDNLLNEMSQQLKMVLCEAETALHYMGVSVPALATADILSEDKWTVRPDYTGALIRDWGVMLIYQNFLNDWSQIMKSVVMKKIPQSCKGSKSTEPRKNRGSRGSSHRPRQAAPS